MYIRRTTIKRRGTAEPYFTYRLVESVRTVDGVRQRTLLNLGRHFDVPRDQWGALTQRIEQLLSAQAPLMPLELDAAWEALAQHLAARLLHRQADSGEAPSQDIRAVDVDSLELVRPRWGFWPKPSIFCTKDDDGVSAWHHSRQNSSLRLRREEYCDPTPTHDLDGELALAGSVTLQKAPPSPHASAFVPPKATTSR